MKPFQTLLSLIVVVLIGGLGFMYWASSVDEVVEPIVDVEEAQEVQGVEDEAEVGPGTYLIFQSVRTSDSGEREWANDDTQEYVFYRLALGEATYRANPSAEDLIAFATIEHGPELGGSLISYIFGQDILIHRYQTSRVYDAINGRSDEGEEIDGILSLNGEITDVRSENWQTFRSASGRFEVIHDFGPSREDRSGTVTVMDAETEEIIKSLTLTLDSGEIGNPEPFLIDNAGEYIYVRQMCGCEASLKGLWEVNLETGEARALHELVGFHSWFQTSLDAENRRLLSISSGHEWSDDGPYEELFPPTTISLLDLTSGEVEELFISDTEAFHSPSLDPGGRDLYLVRPWDDEGIRTIMLFSALPVLTYGSVIDWVGDWLVVEDNQVLKLTDTERNKTILIEMPDGVERFEYVGSIVIDE